MEVSGQLHALGALLCGKSPRYPLYGKFCASKTRSGRYGEEKNLTPTENRTPAIQPIAIPTEVSRLLCIIYITGLFSVIF
jgi:hypothetical protein